MRLKNNQVLNRRKISKRAWMMITLLFMLSVISNVDKAVIGFASVQIIEDLGLTPSQWGMVGGVTFWLYSLSAILIGVLGDRIGTKNAITIIGIILVAVQFSTLAVSSLTFLIITRVILGAGEGPSYSMAVTSAAKWLPQEKLSFGISLISVGGPIGVAVSAPILMFIISTYGWKIGFLATGVVGAIWLLTWLILAKEKPGVVVPFQPREVIKANKKNKTVVLKPNFSKDLFSKNFFIIALCGFATYWSFTIGLNWLPNYLANVRGIKEASLGFAVTLPWLLIALSQISFSLISDRLYKKSRDITRSRVFVLGSLLILAALCYLSGTMVSSNLGAVLLLSLGLMFGCVTLVIGPALLIHLKSGNHQGKIQGWFMAIASLGGIIGPFVTGLFVEKAATLTLGFQYSFFFTAGLLFVFGVLVMFAVRPKKETVTIENQTAKIL